MKPWSRNKEERPEDRQLTASALADIIRTELDMRIGYDDPQGELENLEAVLDELAAVEISVPTIAETVRARANQIAEKVQADTVASHQRHLAKFNSVLIAAEDEDLSDDSCGWMNLQQHAGTSRFERAIDAQAELPVEMSIDQTDVAELVNDFVQPVIALTKEIYDLIPPVGYDNEIGRRKAAMALARYVIKGTIKAEERVFRIYDADAQDEKDRQLAKKSRKLQEALRQLTQDPVDFFASLYIAANEADITEQAQDTVEWSIATRNAEIYRAEGVAVFKPQHQKKEVVETEVEAVVIDLSEDVAATPKVQEKAHESAGLVEMNFPWMSDEPELAGLSVVRSNGKEVYVTRAMSRKFAEISVMVRENSPRDKEGLCKYERIIRHHARRLAEGDRPYKNTNSVKPLRGADYGGVPIWYTHDISPNTPRIYFTLKKLSELTDQTTALLDGKQNPLNPDQLCMVILAETDKAHQIEVLKTVTGMGHKNLRQSGAGSI